MKWLVFIFFCASVWLHADQEEPLSQDLSEGGDSVQEYYGYMQEAADHGDWWAAIDFGELMIERFPDSPYKQEVSYFQHIILRHCCKCLLRFLRNLTNFTCENALTVQFK